MNILLTGGAGYIGCHTAVELIALGYNVVIADNFSNSSSAVIRGIEQITSKRAVAYNADLTNRDDLERIFVENKIDCVIHFAGYKAVGESVQFPLKYYRNNLDCTLTLLETMGCHGVTNLIFSSSATVYGDPKTLPITEEMVTWPCASPYGSTKLMIERIIADVSAADSHFSAVLLRYFNPVGAHKSGLIGEMPNGVPNNLMPYISQVAVGQRERLSVFGGDYPTKDGTCVRDYIHVVDLARGHADAVKYCVAHKGVEAMNLGTGVGRSVLEVIAAFEEANGVKIPYVVTGRREGDVPACYADATKAYQLMGWKAELSLLDMCRDTYRWQRHCADALS